MAIEAPNHYLRSMCVRNAVISACTTLEMACSDALGVTLSNRFKDDVKAGLLKAGKPPIDFGSGLWQDIMTIRDVRGRYAHAGVTVLDRFPPVQIADHAIANIREAIRDIYQRIGKQIPAWVANDSSTGWPQTSGFRMTAHATLVHAGANRNDPNSFNISLVTPEGVDKETVWLPPNTPEEDIMDEIERLVGGLNVPFKGVRVKQGQNIYYEEDFDMPGSSV
jgi:hypothetical protein